MRLPSASQLDRVVACPPSCVLPQVHSDAGEAAYRGTVFHEYIERITNGTPKSEALAMVPEEYRTWCDLVDIEAILNGLEPVYIEQPFAFDVRNGEVRLLEKLGHRDYSAITDHDFFGTVDLIAKQNNGRYLIRDYKTGQDLGDPRVKMQLLFFALCMHVMHDVTEVDIEFLYVDEYSQIRAVTATIGMLEFDETFDRLCSTATTIRYWQSEINRRVPTVKVGDHCKYCPAFASCPAKMGIVKRVMPDLETIEDRLLAMTPEQVGQVWMKYREISNALDRVKSVLDEYVDREQIPLGNGKVVKPVPTARSYLDAKKVVSLARRYGASKEEIDACVTSRVITTRREVVQK